MTIIFVQFSFDKILRYLSYAKEFCLEKKGWNDFSQKCTFFGNSFLKKGFESGKIYDIADRLVKNIMIFNF